jgi:hypothetical protein
MAYQPNIPNASDALAQSQGDIKGNFQALNPVFTQFQNFVLLGVQGSDPATAGNQMALYVKTGLDTNPQMFIERQSGSTDTPVVIEFTGSAKTTNGWTRLPSGILLKWGTSVATANAATAITFPVGATVPAFTIAPFNIQVTLQGNTASHGGAIFLQSIDSATQFTVYSASGTSKTVWYFAIGV